MGKPQQPELGRSGHTPVVEGQHAREVIQGQEQPGTGGPTGPVPEDNQPGHHPDQEQDKPDLDKFAERLGIVSEDEEPPEAPHVDEDSKVTRLKPKAERHKPEPQPEKASSSKQDDRRTFSPIGLALVGPVTGILIAKKVYDGLKRLRR